MKKSLREIYLVLNNVRSTHNVGSIFRTADAAGVAKIYLCGYTPAPTDRFGRPVKEIAKTALGAEKNIPWEKVADLKKLIKRLKKEKVFIAALEQSSKAIDYKTFRLTQGKKPFALILGNEVGGVEPAILKLCDVIYEIPMRGKKESLNVSVATGIAIFRFLNI